MFPVAAPGEYIIRVSDGVISKQIQFKVEQTVPPAPVPVAPASKIKVSAQARFEWQAVSYQYMDVVYEFQIIRNLAEPELVYCKPGLGATSYKPWIRRKADKAGAG
jgi:hypothetical protein